MAITDPKKYDLAKSFTELAIQNGLIIKCSNATDTAKQVTTFFKTVMETLDPPANSSN